MTTKEMQLQETHSSPALCTEPTVAGLHVNQDGRMSLFFPVP